MNKFRNGLLIAAAVGAGVTYAETRTTSNHQKPSEDVIKSALTEELKTAYTGPIVIESAENTGEIHAPIDATGIKRGVIKIKLGGTAINHGTADNHKTPSYYYTDLLEQVYENGSDEGMIGSNSGINSDGEAEIYPRLDNFSQSTPTTYKYVLGVGAYGSTSVNSEIAAIYNAGEVDITGSNGKITSVDVVPTPDEKSKPTIVDLAPGQSLNNFLH